MEPSAAAAGRVVTCSTVAAAVPAPVQLLVSRTGDEDDRVLAELGPGALVEVSNVVGKG